MSSSERAWHMVVTAAVTVTVLSTAGCGGGDQAEQAATTPAPVATTPTAAPELDAETEALAGLIGATRDLAETACEAEDGAEFSVIMLFGAGILADGYGITRSHATERLLVETERQCGDEFGSEIEALRAANG